MSTNPKVPPHNLEAEQSVLGALMLDKEAIVQVADILTAKDFYKPSHALIYDAAMKLFEKGHPIDMLSIGAKLKDDDSLKGVGGSAYLAELVNAVPTSSHVAHYAKIVKEKRVLRDLITASAEINEAAFDQGENDIDSVLDQIEHRIFSIAQHSTKPRFVNVAKELQGAYERIEKLHQNKGALRGISTGFQGLDNYLSGLQKSDMIILGARPSLGKTSLALDIARHAALREKKSVGIFSLEMGCDQVIDRIIAAEARVSLWRLRTGKLTDEMDFQLIQGALGALAESKIFIDDTPSPNILQIRATARRLQAEHGLDLVIIDYLQLLTPRTKTDNVVSQITEISRGLKTLARELNIPVIALSQLSRASVQRDDKVPKLQDLRDSGSIEQDADVVMFIYRKDKEKQNPEPEEINSAEIIIAKHRNGPVGNVKLKFDPERASFDSLDTHHTI
jgi:replicative DNA helicase